MPWWLERHLHLPRPGDFECHECPAGWTSYGVAGAPWTLGRGEKPGANDGMLWFPNPYHPCMVYLYISMYIYIFTFIWFIFMVNVGKYIIHGWYGKKKLDTPRKINGWNLRIEFVKRKITFQTIIFRFYVNLPGCTQTLKLTCNKSPWKSILLEDDLPSFWGQFRPNFPACQPFVRFFGGVFSPSWWSYRALLSEVLDITYQCR